MELVKLTCTNCGAPLEEKDGMLRCAHCGCGYIRVCDPSDGFDAAAMSIEEFEQKLADASVLFAVKGAEGTELFDTDRLGQFLGGAGAPARFHARTG